MFSDDPTSILPTKKCNFHINVTQPGNVLSPQNGNHNYPRDVICTWKLTAPLGKVIRLHFNQFLIQFSRHCYRDNLKIFDGVTSSSDVLGQFCGRTNPADVISTVNEILIFFYSDSSVEDLGFNITYSTENSSGKTCRFTVIFLLAQLRFRV